MKKKIAFLVNSFGKGGAERVVINLARYFDSIGYEILFVTSRIMPQEYEVDFTCKRILLEEELTKLKRRGGIFHRIYGRIKCLRQIWREEEPTVIVSFIGKMNFYAIFSRNKNIPLLLSVRSDPAHEYPGFGMRFMARQFFKKADGVIFQTKEAMAFFPEEVRQKSIVIQNTLDEHFLRPRYEGKRDPEIVMVGRLDENKNQKMLLEVFEEIHVNYPGWSIKLYGGASRESNTQKELETFAAEHGFAKKVHFMGRQSAIYEKIEKASIFALLSGFEGMPNALLEAMALGLAVISTDCPCGGPASVIRNHENGILIPVGDKKALKKALLEYMEHLEKIDEYGQKACLIQKELEPKYISGIWQDYIESKVREYVSH